MISIDEVAFFLFSIALVLSFSLFGYPRSLFDLLTQLQNFIYIRIKIGEISKWYISTQNKALVELERKMREELELKMREEFDNAHETQKKSK